MTWRKFTLTKEYRALAHYVPPALEHVAWKPDFFNASGTSVYFLCAVLSEAQIHGLDMAWRVSVQIYAVNTHVIGHRADTGNIRRELLWKGKHTEFWQQWRAVQALCQRWTIKRTNKFKTVDHWCNHWANPSIEIGRWLPDAWRRIERGYPGDEWDYQDYY